MERDQQQSGQSVIAAPPPRAEDRVWDAPPPRTGRFAPPPPPPPPSADALSMPPPSVADRVEDPTRARRFAREDAAGPGLAPPPRPAQAADTMFMPPPSAADRVVTAEMPALAPPPVTAFPPSPSERIGVYAFPPPLAEHRVADRPPRRGWRRVVVIDRGPPWLGPALLATIGVLLIGAGIGLGAHAIFGGKSHKKSNAPSAVATPGKRGSVTPLTPSNPSTTTPAPTGPATVSPGASSKGKSRGNGQTAPATPVAPGGGSQSTGGGIGSWPSGKTAWTVVLASTGSKSAAESKARQASGRGIQAGVLNSNDYSSLRHGYWVAFAGQYGSSSEAVSAAKRYASQGFAGSYARFVKP